MAKKKPPKNGRLTLLEVGFKDLTEQVSLLKTGLDKQEAAGRNIVIGVLVASFLIASVVAIEVILFHSNDEVSYNKYSHDTKKSEIIKLDDPIK